jgi:hypothetical protein
MNDFKQFLGNIVENYKEKDTEIRDLVSIFYSLDTDTGAIRLFAPLNKNILKERKEDVVENLILRLRSYLAFIVTNPERQLVFDAHTDKIQALLEELYLWLEKNPKGFAYVIVSCKPNQTFGLQDFSAITYFSDAPNKTPSKAEDCESVDGFDFDNSLVPQ